MDIINETGFWQAQHEIPFILVRNKIDSNSSYISPSELPICNTQRIEYGYKFGVLEMVVCDSASKDYLTYGGTIESFPNDSWLLYAAAESFTLNSDSIKDSDSVYEHVLEEYMHNSSPFWLTEIPALSTPKTEADNYTGNWRPTDFEETGVLGTSNQDSSSDDRGSRKSRLSPEIIGGICAAAVVLSAICITSWLWLRKKKVAASPLHVRNCQPESKMRTVNPHRWNTTAEPLNFHGHTQTAELQGNLVAPDVQAKTLMG
jgi:hypothetical protein